ncbi:ATP-dependent DNA ligase [Streptomyces pseudogriseolus]|uniref:ATP-dependent DNA ligase n=1 Tax=Streptomyces pseudogriseolus TaxID=36817 RepID=UPI00347ACCD7
MLADPFVLCSATTDRATAEDWLDPAWGAAGIEGVVVKGLAQRYQPGRRGWIKVRARASAEAVVAAVTGRVTTPSTLLLGRYDARGRLRFIARTAPLSATARREVGALLYPADDNHPWKQRRFSAGWGTREAINHRPVQPDVVVEFAGDTAVDAGRYRHPMRYLRVRDDMSPEQLPPATPGPELHGSTSSEGGTAVTHAPRWLHQKTSARVLQPSRSASTQRLKAVRS